MVQRKPIIIRHPIISDISERTVTISPNPNRLILNDELSRKSFDAPTRLKNELKESMGEDLYKQLMSTRGIDFDVIDSNTQDYGPCVPTREVRSHYHLELEDGYKDTTPLDQFDKEVLQTCMGAQQYGCPALSVDMIFRDIAEVENTHIRANPPMRQKILESVRRLMGHKITIDMTETCERMGYQVPSYPEGRGLGKIESSILPGLIWRDAIVNGNLTFDVIKFDRPSPLFVVAQAKKHLLTYAKCLLSIPNIMNTHQNIMIKNYLMERIMAIRQHPRKIIRDKGVGMYPTIKFSDVAHHSDIDVNNKNQLGRMRRVITKVLDYIIPMEVIKGYTLAKNKGKTVGVHLFFK